MKIQLDYPYCNDWRWGYLRQNREGRRVIDLYNSDKDRSTVSYARYLMSCHVGRYLTTEEEVDHVDQNPTNDEISNLQILSTEDHLKKTLEHRPKGVVITLVCSNCGTSFERRSNKVHKENQNHFCSRSCNGKYYWSKGFNNK